MSRTVACCLRSLLALSSLPTLKYAPARKPNPRIPMTAHILCARFPSQVALPGTVHYLTENTNYWSASTVLAPDAVFVPSSAEDVSEAIKILVSTDTPFAVRSGGTHALISRLVLFTRSLIGHLPVRGAAGTDGGILISLDGLQDIDFGKDDAFMRIGAGCRWGNIYASAEAKGKVVVGGRCPDVGMGLILGGGLSLISGTYGLACDSVTEFEVSQLQGPSHPSLTTFRWSS